MLSKELLDKIKNKEINTRTQLYKFVKKSKNLIIYLNENNLLIPKKITKERFIQLLKNEKSKNGVVKAIDFWNYKNLIVKYYGTWENLLEQVFGEVNQHRYNEMTNEELLNTIINYIKKYKRLPNREEFNGRSYDYPYWGSIVNRVGVKRWSDVLGLIDLSNIKYYHDKKHGTGKVYIYKGITFLSHQEFLIGKYFFEHNIKFEKEVFYDDKKHTFDFYLPKYDVYIEYYGMETKKYKERIEIKRKMYGNRKVIEIFKHDNTIKKLDLEVQRL